MISFIEFENDHFAIDSIVRTKSIKRDRDRSRKYSTSIAYLNFILNLIIADSSFIASRQQKIAELLEKDVFLSVNKTEMLSDIWIFSFRFVNEIKHSSTDKAFEKFRLIVQTFKNQNKIFVLIQSFISKSQSALDHLPRSHYINEAVLERHYSDLRAIAIQSKQKFLRSIIIEADQIDEHFQWLHSENDKISIRRIESRQSLI